MPFIRCLTMTGPSVRRARPLQAVLAGLVITGGVIAITLPASASGAHARVQATRSLQLAQEEAPDESPVSADQINKYIAVYTTMQHDHSVTVDQAASKQGLTVEQFRDIENRIERNPVAHERVLDALKKASKKGKPGASSE